jgi:hypothetical protein
MNLQDIKPDPCVRKTAAPSKIKKPIMPCVTDYDGTTTTEGEEDENFCRNHNIHLEMIFPQTFHQCYRRNNKAGGVKNVRCFPLCSNPHSPQGFCGQAVLAKCYTIR